MVVVMVIVVWMKVISSHSIRSSEHTLQCIVLSLFFSSSCVSIVVKIAKDYFSSANGHISETKIHRHTSIIIIDRWNEKENRRHEGVKTISFLVTLSLSRSRLRRSYLCNFLSHIDEWEKPDTYQHPLSSSFLIFYPKNDSPFAFIQDEQTTRFSSLFHCLIIFDSKNDVYFSSDLQVKRNERDILEGIKQIDWWITEGKQTWVSKRCRIYEKKKRESKKVETESLCISAQSAFFVCLWSLIRRKGEKNGNVFWSDRKVFVCRTVDARELLKGEEKEKSIATMMMMMMMMMIGGVTIMTIVASCCLIDTGVLDLSAKTTTTKK